MPLEDREYYRDGSYTERLTGLGVDFTPVVKYLILANVLVFLLQIFWTRPADSGPRSELIQKMIEQAQAAHERAREAARKARGDKEETEAEKAAWEKRQEEIRVRFLEQQELYQEPGQRASVVQEWFELSPEKTVKQGQVWRLLTCAFCHDRFAIWHLLFNMLCLYWAGTRMESMYGSREFLLFYLAAALFSSAAYIALALYTGSNTPAIGASGAVMGVMMLYAIFYPFETILIFWVLPVPIWLLVAGYVIFDLHPVLLALAGDRFIFGDNVAHAAHLGGLAFGFLYWKLGIRLEALFDRGSQPRRRSVRRRIERAEPTILAHPKRDVLNEQVDEVLRKISEQGQASLTEQERAILLKASAKYRGEE